jgi:TonB family protein
LIQVSSGGEAHKHDLCSYPDPTYLGKRQTIRIAAKMFRALLMILVLFVSMVPGKADPPDPKRIWAQSVRQHLTKFTRFPPGARKRGETGTVRIRFVLDPSGKLVENEIATSSGFADLDNEALAMVRRAAPFPPGPSGTIGAQKFSLPYTFFSKHPGALRNGEETQLHPPPSESP